MLNRLKQITCVLLCLLALTACSLKEDDSLVQIAETGGSLEAFPHFELYCMYNLGMVGYSIQNQEIHKIPQFYTGMRGILDAQAIQDLRDTLTPDGANWKASLMDELGQAVESTKLEDGTMLLLFDAQTFWTCFLGERRIEIPKTTPGDPVTATCYENGFWYWVVPDGIIRIDCTDGTWLRYPYSDTSVLYADPRSKDWNTRALFSPNPETLGFVYNYFTAQANLPWDSKLVLHHLGSSDCTILNLEGGCLAVYPQEDGSLLAVTTSTPEHAWEITFTRLDTSGEILKRISCPLPYETMLIDTIGATLLKDGVFYGWGFTSALSNRDLILYGYDTSSGEMVGWQRLQLKDGIPRNLQFTP